MADLIAVDPGARWTGVAYFDIADNQWGWECTGVYEFDNQSDMGNDQFVDGLASEVLDNKVPILVYEKWRLYEDKALEQTGKEFPEIQLIGQMKFIVRRHNEHCYLHTRALNAGQMTTCELRGASCATMDVGWLPTLMYCQPADILDPTTGILRGKKIKSVAKPIAAKQFGNRKHVVCAELHGWYNILRGAATGKNCETIYGNE